MKPTSNLNQSALEEVLAAARLYRHNTAAVSPLLQERIRLLLGFVRMRRAGVVRAIYCDNCESRCGFFVDMDTGRQAIERAAPQFISWSNAAAVLAAFDEQPQRKPAMLARMVCQKVVNQ